VPTEYPRLIETPVGPPVARRPTFLSHEVSFLLECDERAVKKLLDSRAILDVSRDGRLRIGADQVLELLADGVDRGEISPLGLHLAGELVAGRLEIPAHVGDRATFVASCLRPRTHR
jgi:hypothetical protein